MKNRHPATSVILVVVFVLASASHAGHHGFMHGHGGPHGGMGGMASGTPYFSGSAVCAQCHNWLFDAGSNDVSIFNDWSSAMMANSSRDPLWRAKVESEVLRNPALREEIEERCARCHTPMASAQSRIEGQKAALLQGGFLDPGNQLHDLARDGVSCTLCHQIHDRALGTRESFSGGFTIDGSTQRPFRPLFGPFMYPFSMPMVRMAGFTPAFASHIKGAELCATCHTLYVPVVDRKGRVVGEVPEQTPYLEWRHSSYGDGRGGDDRSCQGCHMPEAYGEVVLSVMPHHLTARQPFAKHHFVGANTFVPALLSRYGDELGVGASPASLGKTLTRTRGQLQNATAEISVARIERKGEAVEVTVRVTNKAGHKFPTGFPLRRAWIHLSAARADGQTIFDSGRPNPDGTIAHNEADVDPLRYEPHYDVITNPEQVQIYEEVTADTEGEVTYSLMRAATHVKDNRLLPAGFDKKTAPEDIRPHGQALEDANFVGGSDLVTYRIPAAGLSGFVYVTAEILFQPVSYAFAKDLGKLDAGSEAIRRFSRYYMAADKGPVIVSTATATLPLP